MKWHADSYFEIGAGHKVCQDYATHSEKIAVLSDGCSSMPDTDIGARLICKNALAACPLSMHSLVQSSFSLGIHPDAFYATCMRVWLDDDGHSPPVIRATIEGDGCIIVRRAFVGVSVSRIDYDLNAPWYPVYEHLLSGHHRFVSTETCFATSFMSIDRDLGCDHRKRTYTFDARQVDFVAVCSDGLTTFTDKDGRKKYEQDLAKDLADIKIVSGSFIKRRVGALKRNEWSGLSHDDDFSIAVLARSEE